MSKKVKCIIWDLDNTLWDGILLESDNIKLKPGIEDILIQLDKRGVLNCIASKNDYTNAVTKLKSLNVDQYFIYKEINWNAKSESVGNIKKNLNIGMDTIIFIDDQEFELDEVKSVYNDITVINAKEYKNLLTHPFLKFDEITEDSKKRRQMYLENIQRIKDEESYKGPKKEFLEGLNMKLLISKANESDLKRVHELTVRTNQLNATGTIYSYEELKQFIDDNCYNLLVCELSDKYGTYGKIGIVLIEEKGDLWTIKLLLMSCRVMSRSIGTILLALIEEKAREKGKRLQAHFRKTDKNRMMYITYKFSNFNEVYTDEDGLTVFENDLSQIHTIPSYVKIEKNQI